MNKSEIVGKTVKIVRWDGNGTWESATIIDVGHLKGLGDIYTTSVGYFIIPKNKTPNAKITFIWTEEDREWYQKYQNTVRLPKEFGVLSEVTTEAIPTIHRDFCVNVDTSKIIRSKLLDFEHRLPVVYDDNEELILTFEGGATLELLVCDDGSVLVETD